MDLERAAISHNLKKKKTSFMWRKETTKVGFVLDYITIDNRKS